MTDNAAETMREYLNRHNYLITPAMEEDRAFIDGPAPADASSNSVAEVVAAAARELRAQNDAARDLLGRIREWDHLPLTGDGPYWMREIDNVLANAIPNSAATTPAEQRLQREHEAEALRVTKSPFGTVGDPKSPGHTSPNSAANFVPTPFEAWGQPKLDEVLAPMLASTWWNGTDPLAAHYACMAMLQALIEGGYDVVAT